MSQQLESILVICTGNVCRSLLAQHLLSSRLPAAWPESVVVVSAGTQPIRSVGPCRLVQKRCSKDESTAIPSSYTPVQVESSALSNASLILTATCDHRSAVGRFDRDARERTFTLVEAAAILSRGAGQCLGRSQPGPQTLRELSVAMNVRRVRTPDPVHPRRLRNVHQPKVWDIADGHFRGRMAHGRTLDAVAEAVDQVLQGLKAVRSA